MSYKVYTYFKQKCNIVLKLAFKLVFQQSCTMHY